MLFFQLDSVVLKHKLCRWQCHIPVSKDWTPRKEGSKALLVFLGMWLQLLVAGVAMVQAEKKMLK